MSIRFLPLTLLMVMMFVDASAQTAAPSAPSKKEQAVIELSRQKWLWMAARDTDALDKLIDPQAIFVHMGATMDKRQEIDVIESGRIEYKQADIEEITARTIGDTAIVLSRIQLFAMVGGNEARNPFMVTETFVRRSGEWKLVALAFTRRMTPQVAPTASQQVDRAGTQPSTSAAADFFSGKARIDPLFAPTRELSVASAYVTFEPGAHSSWHTHPGGQRLIVTAGVGRTQEWGKPLQEIRAGDVVVCPPGVKHWHGASPTEGMTHLAITASVDGKTVEWLERVTDEQYAGR